MARPAYRAESSRNPVEYRPGRTSNASHTATTQDREQPTILGMTTTARAARRLTPTNYKLLLLLHIVSSVGWLGLNVGNLTLAVIGLTTDDPATQHVSLSAMYLIGGTLLIPVSLLALTSGVLLGIYTRWGLIKYKWVLVKLALTIIAVVLIPLSLLPGLRELRDLMTATPAGELADLGRLGSTILTAGLVSTAMYVTNSVLSVLKPWGRVRA